MHKKKPLFLVWLAIALLCAIALFLSLSQGQYAIPLSHVWYSIFPMGTMTATPEEQAVLWNIRMPRTLVGFLVGAALAVAGTIMQAVFVNPLADPAILGVSSGASLGAVIAISFGGAALSLFYLPAFAIMGAVAAITLTVVLAYRHGRMKVMALLLAGVVVGMLFSALTSGILTMSTNQQLHQYLFWTIGGLDYRRWEHVILAAGPIISGIIVTVLLSRHLNVLVLGEQEARALGMPVLPFRLFLLALASFMTAVSVCVSGNIGFVGLVMPHMMRFIVGSDHRRLIPAAALAGGIFLVICDTLGRVIFPTMEIRAGIMTALLGTPYFLYLLHHRLS
jgi:iron complex transport system permease protein